MVKKKGLKQNHFPAFLQGKKTIWLYHKLNEFIETIYLIVHLAAFKLWADGTFNIHRD